MPTEAECILPPTQRLTPIKLLRSGDYDLTEINAAIEYLRSLYNPPVRGSSRRKNAKRLGTTRIQVDGNELRNSSLDSIRSDSFERNFAVRWLTTLISNIGLQEFPNSVQSSEILLQNAASLLAACSGTAATGKVTREFSFGPIPRGEEVRISLTDAPLENQDYSSVGAQTWGGACILAELLTEDPGAFSIPECGETVTTPSTFRVLELGAGTGLTGLTLYKLLVQRGVHGSVVLTDFHPSVLRNLEGNVHRNEVPITTCEVHVARLDWETFHVTSNDPGRDACLAGPFDLILGGDIIYEENHAVWIKKCLEILLRRPTAGSSGATFHLVIPLRSTHTLESSTIEQVFSTMDQVQTPRELHLAIIHHERILCDAHSATYDNRAPDRADEVEYAYYRIGWIR